MPSGYNLDRPWVAGKGIQLIYGSFAPNATSDPSSASFKGTAIKSVVRKSQGVWTVTLRTKGIRSVEAALPGVQLSADNVDQSISFGAFTNVGASQTGDTTFDIRNAPGGSVADIAANANNRVSFMLVARRSVNK